MNTAIADFTDAEQKLASTSFFGRYGKLVPIQLADSELQLDALSEELTSSRKAQCAVMWDLIRGSLRCAMLPKTKSSPYA